MKYRPACLGPTCEEIAAFAIANQELSAKYAAEAREHLFDLIDGNRLINDLLV